MHGYAATREAAMAAFAKSWRREVVVEAGILPSLNVKTARLWRAIVPFTHLAREGRMTVTIVRRKFLATLGGAASIMAACSIRAAAGDAGAAGLAGPRLTVLGRVSARLK
jgi:uncharacterized membrane protein